MVLVKGRDIWEDIISTCLLAEFDIISDIPSIDVFPFVPEGDADNFILADDTVVLVDALSTCLPDVLETCSIYEDALVIIDELDVIKCDVEAEKDGCNDVMLAAIVIVLTDWKDDEIDWLSSTEFVSITRVLLGVFWFRLVDGVIAGILNDDVDIDIGEYVSTRNIDELDDIIVDDEYWLMEEVLLSEINKNNIYILCPQYGMAELRGYDVWRHFQQYVSFIGGGNRSTCRKPLTCRKSLTNFIT